MAQQRRDEAGGEGPGPGGNATGATAAADDCRQPLSTPADLSTKSRETYKVGRCILTSVHYRDIGLVDDDGKLIFGPNSKKTRLQKRARPAVDPEPSADTPLTEEEEDLRLQMQLMGLPTAFTGTVELSSERSTRDHQPEEPESHGMESSTASDWQQAYDWTYGAYYYYNETTQETQWEPPAEGFCPAPVEWSHTAVGAACEEDRQRGSEPSAGGSGGIDRGTGGQRVLHGFVMGSSDHEERRETTGLLRGEDSQPAGSHLRFSDDPEDGGLCSTVAPAADNGGGSGVSGVTHDQSRDIFGDDPERSAGDEIAPATASAGTGKGIDGLRNDDATHSAQRMECTDGVARELTVQSMETGGRGESAPGPSRRLLKKYWQQRYSLFHRFDRGIQMDEEAWYSVTPEVLADHQAQRCASGVAIDAFTGAGGNAIALAKSCSHVIAIDISHQRLGLAKQNAAVYGVTGTVDFICGDFFRLAPHLAGDVVFLSPPWGGPEYVRSSAFRVDRDLGGMGLGLPELLRPALAVVERRRPTPSEPPAGANSRGVSCFLPRNVDLDGLSGTVEEFNGNEDVEVERNILNGVLKGVTVYYGHHQPQPQPSASALLMHR